MARISVIIITLNEERNVERCLRSVLWADEVVVVDAMSGDRTVEISRSLGATVVHRRWEGFGKQKAFALSCAHGEWVLALDADEVVPAELREEICSAVAEQRGDDGYRIARKSFFLGKWIQHGGWYPGYQLRLFKRELAHVYDRPVHEGFEVAGRVGTLQGALMHYTYRSLSQYLEKLNDYTSLDVMSKVGGGTRRFRPYHFIINPVSAFLRMFVSLRGFRDGFHGFLLACYSAFSVLVLYAKCWEYQRTPDEPPVTPERVALLKRLA